MASDAQAVPTLKHCTPRSVERLAVRGTFDAGEHADQLLAPPAG